jgi:hypothetical protein
VPRRKVLALGEEPAAVQEVGQALASIGVEVDLFGSAQQVGAMLPYRYVFYVWDGDMAKLSTMLGFTRPVGQLILVAKEGSLSQTIAAMRDPRINHVLAPSRPDYSGLIVTAVKLFTGDIFGIEKYLPPATQVRYVRLRDYGGRTKAIDAVTAFAEGCGIRSKVRASIAQACEELLMNALYDAPVDEGGHSLFGQVSTKDRLGTPSPKPVSIRYAATEDRFAIAVRDRFGRLEKDTILNYLHKCMTSDQQIDRKEMGAGLGLYLVANAASEYVVNIAPGIATEVVCTFERKTARTPLRVMSVFLHPGEQAAAGTTAGATSAAG